VYMCISEVEDIRTKKPFFCSKRLNMQINKKIKP
jgi:hypothetical protein